MVAGGVGLLLLLIGLFVDREQFFRSYLYAFVFWTGLSLGSLSWLLLQNLVGGGWGLITRRPHEAATRVLPVMALLFLPLLFGLGSLYAWSHQEWRDAHGTMHFKLWWLTKGFFIVRTVCYFLVWIGLALLLNKWSLDEDRGDGTPRFARRMEGVSGPGLVLYVVTVTLAIFDWVMTLDTNWYSTIFAVLFIVGFALAAHALMIMLLSRMTDRRPYAGVLNANLFHDLGNLLLAFTILWAYVQFSQLLIMWSGNLAEETPYYVRRIQQPGWKYVALALVVLHFFVPFALLLLRRTKRAARSLAVVALILFVMRFIDTYWIIAPAFGAHGGTLDSAAPQAMGLPTNFHPSWMDLAALLALGGIWFFAFASQLKRRPILPPNDARLLEVSAHHG
jgi:hypothetical protein